MKALDKYIQDHPEGVEKFKADNMELVNKIKGRFRKFTTDGNLLNRVLLADALFNIMEVERDLSKTIMKAQLEAQGLVILEQVPGASDLDPTKNWWLN